jgi:6-phosphofructokinase
VLTRNDRSRAGFRVFAVYEGFEGLVRGDVREVDWMTVNGWSSIGGSLLGTSRAAPKVPPPNNNNNN